ncbi:MAG: hypothetical protein FJ095_08695 [Deltaproteobacteria bacterium]|nr:hypothetical protein [Deltaproteobacteria bacterium]
MIRLAALLVVSATLTLGCSSSSPPSGEGQGTTARFELEADFAEEGQFFAFPQPSDLRLDANGAPDFAGFPNPKVLPTIDLLKAAVADRRGVSVLPVAYFQFDAPLAERDPAAVVRGTKDAPILLVGLEPNSPDRGRLIPVVARVLAPDVYVPENVLAVAARPGFVLRGDERYAVVVRRSLSDAAGKPLGVPTSLATLASGGALDGERGAKAKEVYAPLWETLASLGIPATEVAAATVFKTGDVVRENHELGKKVRDAHSVTLESLALAPDDETPDLCVLRGHVDYPQFQRGMPPFNTEGLFELGADGLPIKQRVERAPVVIAIPKRAMPAKGFPLEVFVHGSGGYSQALISPRGDDDKPRKGAGPAHVLARHGIATAGSAMPVNPERLPGAAATAYVNPNNIPATRDIFRQGVMEQMLFIDALLELELPATLLDGCVGATLPSGATAFRFDAEKLVGAGQSMGAWYTNLIAPLEPRMRAVVPTGAGGYLTLFLTTTGPEQSTIAAVSKAVGPILFGLYDKLDFFHPAAALAEATLEPADPITGQPRIALRPLDGVPPHAIYTPVGQGDSYFSNATFEAVELAYGVNLAGEPAWAGLAEALALDGRGESLAYPVALNLTSESGEKVTAVAVSYNVTGFDPHALYSYDDRVRHQFGCFLATELETGVARVVAPGTLDAPCK